AGIIISVFIFPSIFDKDAYQRNTFFNRYKNSFPYQQIITELKNENRPLKIYAPMETEPSHFYLAKCKALKKIEWNRQMPQKLSEKNFLEKFKESSYDYLLLPYSNIEEINMNFKKITLNLLISKAMKVKKTFDYKGHKLILLKANTAP
ncbi:MAG: hypothetical protein KAI33_10635, partial [Elusimicrobiales bacterium]|nr:hypothetical protein [Elusimicrobiales bacterium]